MGADARQAKAQSILGAVRSAAQVTRAGALVRGQTGATGSVSVDGVSIVTNYGYPQALAAGNGATGIVDAAGLDTPPATTTRSRSPAAAPPAAPRS